jgi:cellulose synthase/poly-beta-1,6-N-acetylglucosamine synthase-like glycosyltransferase
MVFIAYLVLILSFVNLFRMAIFLIASDIYDIKNIAGNQSQGLYSIHYQPLVTIVVPAHNEEKTLKQNLLSIADSSYKNIELIIVSDSSTDKTLSIAKSFQRKFRQKFKKIKVLQVQVRGKARALNAGLKHAKGSLFMCLDADSFLTSESLKDAVSSFREKSLGALSSNVKIDPNKGILNWIQRVEYLVCYQMKKAETLTRIQYIVGGIGSMYRTNLIRKLNWYETNTVTEDIDLSMKLLEVYGKKKKIGYNPNVVVYTTAVVTIFDLIRQRFRWKYGRYQVFLKRQTLFLSRKHNFWLSWIYLPYALFAEFTFLFEPLTIALIFYLIFRLGDLRMIVGSLITFCFYTIIQISGATQSYSRKERLKLEIFAPFAYIFMYILSFVEYVATIKGIFNFRKLFREYKVGYSNCDWVHVKRSK